MPDRLTVARRLGEAPGADGSQTGALDVSDSPLQWVALVVFSLSIVVAIATHRVLYADGAAYATFLLQRRDFVVFWPSRAFLDYLQQLLPVVALKLGVRDHQLVLWLLAVGCFAPWPVVLLVCRRIAPRALWLVMLAAALGYLNSAFVAVGYHTVAHAAIWPIVFVVLFAAPQRPWHWVTALACALLLVRSYESALFLNLALVLLIAMRARPRSTGWRQSVLPLTLVALLLLGALQSLAAVLRMAASPNAAGFRRGPIELWSGLPMSVQIQIVIVVALIVLWAVRLPFLGRWWSWFGVPVVIAWGVLPWLAPARLDVNLQHAARFLNLAIPLGLIPIAWVVAARPAWLRGQQRNLAAGAALALLGHSAWHLSATLQWQGYLKRVGEVLAARSGVIPFRETPLGAASVGTQALGFSWPWAMPYLSLYADADRRIDSVIEDQKPPWRRFDPLRPASYPRLDRYGIDLGPLAAAVAGADHPLGTRLPLGQPPPRVDQ